MASKQMLVVVAAALAVAFLPALAVATEHIVGDDQGWVLGFDYAAWAANKQFVVGDTLVFKYDSSSHNLVEVGGADFKACNQGSANALRTGMDTITLDKAGRRWFFCGVEGHCKDNMKIKITVLDAAAPAPEAPLPPPPASSPAEKMQARVARAAVAVTALAAAVLVL